MIDRLDRFVIDAMNPLVWVAENHLGCSRARFAKLLILAAAICQAYWAWGAAATRPLLTALLFLVTMIIVSGLLVRAHVVGMMQPAAARMLTTAPRKRGLVWSLLWIGFSAATASSSAGWLVTGFIVLINLSDYPFACDDAPPPRTRRQFALEA